jgi:hypothetical protein
MLNVIVTCFANKVEKKGRLCEQVKGIMSKMGESGSFICELKFGIDEGGEY